MPFFDTLQQRTEADRAALFSVPVIQHALMGEIDVAQYIAFLSQAYHHVRHTVPLLMACGSRLDRRHEWLRTAIAEYIEEELGHEEWVLNDIAACGGDPDQVRHSKPHASTELMVAYAYHQIDRGNPVGFFGMVHVLEGTSTALASNAAETIQTVLRLPANAFSYLNSHGSLDLEHVKFFESLVNRLDREEDKDAVVHTAAMIYKLYGDIFRSLPARASQMSQAAQSVEA
ncbi:iron-containing redox enzyme family protein [uncultured Oxalicibacterium sp.]|uniref:TenA family transcriptional regulator n=1 Tax=uncultured Oxalicibacterium sp. TaxID=1168540 RepID=UPI0025EAF889|nr:iron-containing redox enzyme family protein [uncultured Oxalicibacterium sp.]